MSSTRIERSCSYWNCSSSGRAADGSKNNFPERSRMPQILYMPPLQPTDSLMRSVCARAERRLEPSRRHLLQMSGSISLLAATAVPSQAINMPQAFDNAWSAMGGGPADLTFPNEFLGRWLAESTLVKVETPLGPDFIPNPQVVERALREDLKQRIRYEVSYIRNNKGKVIIDRRFNTSSLMNLYMGRGAVQEESVKWDPEDPNKLFVQLPGGTNIVTRVVRRSEERQGLDKINTSEFFEQIFQAPGAIEPRVKASQCFTKYKWRTQTEAAKSGGPEIVATQVVSDYLTPYDGEAMMLRANSKPVVVYTYNMSFRRTHSSLDA